MKVADKAGQLLAFSIDGVDLSSREIDRYRKLNPGNIILIGPNIKGEAQVKKLTNQLQSINSLIPLFVSIDQEGGAVKRIPWDSTSGQKNWENMTESDLCNEAKQRSSLLLKLGINMNYAPVVDLTHFDNAFINNRTISIDPKIVSSVAKAYINCSQETGIINTLKHYPGHGSTTLDSHDSLPVVSKSDWLDSDAVPFRENLQTKQIMVAHLIYEKIDPENPTSCSKIFITDILRNKWKYDGLIITDDMNMLHDSTGISVKEALVKVFNAGNDMAIYVATLKKNEEVKSELVSLINSEKIPMHRVDESLMRILKAKRNLFY